MIKCEICGREFVNLNGFTSHISRGHGIKIEEYYLKFINPNKGICVECGCVTTFINFRDGYKKYCSVKCSVNSDEVKNKFKETCVKKYGCENPMQNDEIKNKHKETCNKNFGSDHPLQNKEIQNKLKITCKEKYGCEYPSQNKEIKNKKKETCKKNFGCENPMQNDEIKNKHKETCNKNFGCENPSQSEIIKNKRKETCKERFGCEYSFQSEEVKNKSKITCVERYGHEHPLQNSNISKRASKNRRLNFKKIQKKYPELIKCEELISGSNGEVLGHCKNSNCKNSKENGGYFELASSQIWYRNLGINSIKDGDYLYCCEECKKECPLFRRSSDKLDNLISDDPEILYTSEEYSTFKNEVLSRQLLENKEHTLNYCEICHSTENLQVHHIQPRKLEPGYSLDPPNGLILCRECHFKHGHKKGTECSTGNLSNKFCK